MDKNEQFMNEIFARLQGQTPTLDNPEQMVDSIMSEIKPRRHSSVWLMTVRACSAAASLLLIAGYAFLRLAPAATPVASEESLSNYQQHVRTELAGRTPADCRKYLHERLTAQNTYELLKKKTDENHN
jgi:hypothetical protein